MHARLSLTLIVGLFGASLFAQSAPLSANPQWLSGTWKLDKSGPPDDEKNWNRPTGQRTSSGEMKPVSEFFPTYSVGVFGRQLIAPAETLKVGIQGDRVTIEDDFREPTLFDPRDTASLNVVTRRAYVTEAGWVEPPNTIAVKVKTSWQGDTLTQELWTRTLPRIVRVKRTFLRAGGGRQMLLVIKVLEPKLKEPVKDIERVYTRQPS